MVFRLKLSPNSCALPHTHRNCYKDKHRVRSTSCHSTESHDFKPNKFTHSQGDESQGETTLHHFRMFRVAAMPCPNTNTIFNKQHWRWCRSITVYFHRLRIYRIALVIKNLLLSLSSSPFNDTAFSNKNGRKSKSRAESAIHRTMNIFVPH